MENLSEKVLWEALKSGDLKAFSSFFKIFYPELHNYGLKISHGNIHITEDCLQDFFLYIFNQRNNLADLKTLRPYLYASFRRRLIKDIVKAKKNSSSIISEMDVVDINYSIEDVIIQQEISSLKQKTLVIHLNKLSKRQKEILYLKYYNNLSINEIAIVLDINYQSVVNTIHKAIKKLREDARFNELIENIL